MDRQQLLEAIVATFPEQPIPDAQTMLGSVDDRNQESAEELRSSLAGRSWRKLTPEFAGKWWAWFGYLKPEAYCYYLPALLAAPLGEDTNDSDLMSSMVFALRPCFEALFQEGEDSQLQANQAELTERQYRIVCDFLGVAFDEGTGYSMHEPARTLRWAWNRFDTPALQAANAYYHEMRTFSCPESKDLEIAELCREIQVAFAATPYPGDNALCEGGGEEPGEIALDLRGVSWQSAHPTLLERCYAALSFLSDAGFRYFLPAFLRADLMRSELGYEGNAEPVHTLTRGLYDKNIDLEGIENLRTFTETHWQEGTGEHGVSYERILEMLTATKQHMEEFDQQAYAIRRYRLFNDEERRAIIHYLEYNTRQEYHGVQIHQALERYWRPSLQTPKTELAFE